MSRSTKFGYLNSFNISDILPWSERQLDVYLVLEKIFYPTKIATTFFKEEKFKRSG